MPGRRHDAASAYRRLPARPLALQHGVMSEQSMATLERLGQELFEGRITSVELVDSALAAAHAAGGEGARVFTRVYAEEARERACAADARLRSGRAPPALCGLPVSIKDVFDVADEVTPAGSIALRCCDAPGADSAVVSRLKAAGAVIVGRTNMSELGFSSLGLNPHHGTPRNPFDRGEGRIPGGSSSGAAISVTDGMAAAAICSDTGGSARVPAALCGLVGYKPTAGRVSTEGMIGLSPSHDTVGMLAPSVSCCALLYAALTGEPSAAPKPLPLQRLVLGVPATMLLDDLDRDVATTFQRSLEILSAAGATIAEVPVPVLGEVDYLGISGGIVAAEAHRRHEPLLASRAPLFDPEILGILRAGAELSGLDYVRLLRQRRRGVGRIEEALRGYDLLLMPTVPIVAPLLQPLAGDRIRSALTHALLVRNPSLVNFLDWCALTLPCHRGGEAPVGLTVAARRGQDAMLLSIGTAMEKRLAARAHRS